MTREFIGIIRNEKGEVVAVVNPDDDRELDDPCFNFGEMVRVPRGEYQGALSFDDVAALVKKHQR